MRAIQWARQKLGWRTTVALAGFLALAGTGIAIPGQALAATAKPAANHSPSATEPCARVQIIGDRGSGQPYDTTGPFKGFGPEVYKAITLIEAKLHAKKVSYAAEPIGYPAVSVNVLKPSLLDLMGDYSDYEKNHLDKFLGSIAAGVKLTVEDAEVTQVVCPSNTRIIMVGYSQGAMVMHQAELVLKTKDRAAYNDIIGTVLVADGNRQGNTKAKEFGTSPADGSGIETWVTNTLHHGQPYADVPLPGTTANICNGHDLVCDASAWTFYHFTAAAKVHATSYANCNSKNQCSYGLALTSGATWVGEIAASKV